jgi:hypothetical protein
MYIVRNYKIPAVVLFALSLFAKDLFGQSQAKQKVQEAASVLQRSLKSIPQQVLNKSVCVLVVLREPLAEIGASGFISCRIGDTKSWSSPGSVRFWGASLASLIKEHDFVFLAMNRKSANSIISEKVLLDAHSSALQGRFRARNRFPQRILGPPIFWPIRYQSSACPASAFERSPSVTILTPTKRSMVGRWRMHRLSVGLAKGPE